MKSLLRAAFVALAILSIPSWSRACTCEFYGSPRATLRRAKVVFVGEVLEVTHSVPGAGTTSYAARFRVERYWKGVKSSEITVHTDLYGCGPNLEVGRKYLVYGMRKTLETACTGTRSVELAAEDLRAIGPGKEFKKVEGAR